MKTARSGPKPSRARSASKLGLATEGAAPRAHVEQVQVIAVEHDQARTGTQGHTQRIELAERLR